MASVAKGSIMIRSLSQARTRCSYPMMSLVQSLHTSLACQDFHDEDQLPASHRKLMPPKKFLTYNDVVYPPTKEGEEPRPAEYCLVKKVVGSSKKYWYPAVMVRGMAIDEAIRQCEFSNTPFPKVIRAFLIEAQNTMVEEYNVEFSSNMWIADSYVTKGGYLPGHKKTTRHVSKLQHPMSTYFLRLREGQPPEHYYAPEKSGYEKLDDYIKEQRERRIRRSL